MLERNTKLEEVAGPAGWAVGSFAEECSTQFFLGLLCCKPACRMKVKYEILHWNESLPWSQGFIPYQRSLQMDNGKYPLMTLHHESLQPEEQRWVRDESMISPRKARY